MDYTQNEFNELLEEITTEVERIYTEVDVAELIYVDNVHVYNRLTTILLTLKDIK